MYLAVDVGGTKTLVATFTNSGKLHEQVRFETPRQYPEFLSELQKAVKGLTTQIFAQACVAIPGKIDHDNGVAIGFGNLDWENIPVKKDLQRIIECPVIIENDAKLAGLAEAINVIDDYKKVLYLTISTGIGAGVTVNGMIDKTLINNEVGQMYIQHNDRLEIWEDFASGRAIKEKYGKFASEINDKKTWREICYNLALGINTIIAAIQPDVIIIGGGVGTHFKKYGKILKEELLKFSTPMTPVPPLRQAVHAELAVIYGCYHLAHQYHEKSS